jgi:hypothetical protein
MTTPNPFDIYDVCTVCGKAFEQLAQHITKSHTGYAIRFVDGWPYMSFNGMPEIGGEQPWFSEDNDEWLWYPDGSSGVETIGLVRSKKTRGHTIWRSGKNHKKMYLHNVKIVGL